MNPKGQIVSLAIIVVITCLIAYAATGSVNPFEVYGSGSTAMKIVVTILLVLLGLSGLGLLMSVLVTGKCAHCGKPLMAYAQVLGGPVICPVCHKTYHKKCFESIGGTLRGGCGCREREAGSGGYDDTQQPF